MTQEQLYIKWFPDLNDNMKNYYHSLREVNPRLETFYELYIKEIAEKVGTTPYYTKEWKQLDKYPIWKMMKNHKFAVLLEGKWELLIGYENAKEGKKRYITRSNIKIEGIENMIIREIFKKTLAEMGINDLSQIGKVEMLEYKESCGDFWGNWTETHTKYKVDGKFIFNWIK